MGFNKDLMFEIADLETELEEESPTHQRRKIITRKLQELYDLQRKYNEALHEIAKKGKQDE